MPPPTVRGTKTRSEASSRTCNCIIDCCSWLINYFSYIISSCNRLTNCFNSVFDCCSWIISHLEYTWFQYKRNECCFILGARIYFQGTCIKRLQLTMWHRIENCWVCVHVRCWWGGLVRIFGENVEDEACQIEMSSVSFPYAKHQQQPFRATRDTYQKDKEIHRRCTPVCHTEQVGVMSWVSFASQCLDKRKNSWMFSHATAARKNKSHSSSLPQNSPNNPPERRQYILFVSDLRPWVIAQCPAT